MADASLHLSDENFQKFLSDHPKNVIFVEFYADWCPHCQVFGPVLENFARTWKPRQLSVIKIDTDSFQDTAQQYGVELLPTTVVLVDGQEKERFVGERELPFLENLARKYVPEKS